MASEHKYLLSDNPTETERLVYLHDTLVAGFNDQLIFAPVAMDKPGLRILDSACADGTWLKAAQKQITSPSYELVGADLSAHFFPAQAAPHTRFLKQSIAEPWPVELHNSFDLVNQRLAVNFAQVAGATMQQAIDGLYSITKPGGWIQLCEAAIEQSSASNEAERRVVQVGRILMRMLQTVPEYGDLIPGMLEKSGCVDVQTELFDVPYGALAKDEYTREASTRAMNMSLVAVGDKCKGKEVEGMTGEWMEETQAVLRKWVPEHGIRVPHRVAWGRKPE